MGPIVTSLNHLDELVTLEILYKLQRFVSSGRGSAALGTCQDGFVLYRGYKLIIFMHLRAMMRQYKEIMNAMWKLQRFKLVYLIATIYVLTLSSAVYGAFGCSSTDAMSFLCYQKLDFKTLLSSCLVSMISMVLFVWEPSSDATTQCATHLYVTCLSRVSIYLDQWYPVHFHSCIS